MNWLETTGKLLLVTGGTLLLVGGLLCLISKFDFLGHLPGDFQITRPGFTCLVPVASSVAISIVLTILLNVIIRIIRR